MPVEVIDLLSSPDILPPKTKPINARLKPPSPALDNDVFDLTADSPPRALQERHSAINGAKRSRPRIARTADDLLFMSDDFDTTVGLEDTENLGYRPPTKKPRLSGRSGIGIDGSKKTTFQRSVSATKTTSFQRSVSAASGTTGRVVLQSAAPRKSNFNIEQIEFTSSPHFPGSSKPVDTFDSDPFASSPHLAPSTKHNGRYASHQAIGRDIGKGNVPDRKSLAKEALFSDPFASSPPPQNKGSKGHGGWDHISSSAPEVASRDSINSIPVRGFARSRSDVIDLENSDSNSMPESSDDEFPDLDSIKLAKPKRAMVGKTKIGATQRTKVVKSTTATAPKKTAAEKVMEKLDKAAAKEAEKKRKQEEKERAAALAEVNKKRTNKKDTRSEMIVDLPSSLHPTIVLQIETLLEHIKVQNHFYESPVKDIKIVKWRRKVNSRYNPTLELWEPVVPVHMEAEKHIMVILKAAEFVELALGAKGSDIEAHVLRVQRHFDDSHTLIYLIEGLAKWQKENKKVRNRQFASAVRGDDLPSAQHASRRKKNAESHVYIDDDMVEDALLKLQVLHGALIHHTAVPVETAYWISIFTEHISTVPYRRQEQQMTAGVNFCMDKGQIRGGVGPEDTYIRMLQEITRVTVPIAQGIADEYRTVTELIRGLEDKGPLALDGIQKGSNKDGAFTNRAIGPAVSRRIHKIFTGRDERSMDI